MVVAGGGGRRWCGVGEPGQAGLQDTGLQVGDQRGAVQSGVGDPVAVTVWHGDKPVRRPLPTFGSGGASEGSVAVGDVSALIVEHTLVEAVPEDLEPAVAQRARRGVVALAGGDLWS